MASIFEVLDGPYFISAAFRKRLFDHSGVSHATPDEIHAFGRAGFIHSALELDPAFMLALFPTHDEYVALGLDRHELFKHPWRGFHASLGGRGLGTWPAYGVSLDFLAEIVESWIASRGQTPEAFRADWQERYLLTDPWCWEMVAGTALMLWPYWQEEPDLCRCYIYAPRQTRQKMAHEIHVGGFPLTSWIPSHDSRKAFRDRLLEHVDNELDRIVDEQGLLPVPAKLNDHLRWLALYTIGRKTYASIAAREFPGVRAGEPLRKKEETVRQGVIGAAELVGLTLPRR